MGEVPLVSAVITSYNRREYVCEAVESALAQTYANLEVIVVDDGSTDGSPDLIRDRFGSRVRLVEQENAGVGATRNRGVAEARGSLVAFLDDDDVWLPEKTRLQVEELLRHGPDVVVVGGATRYIDRAGTEILKPSIPGDRVTYEQICVWTALPGSCSNELIRREAFEAVGGFDPDLRRAQDRELYIRLAAMGEIRMVRTPTLLKRVHDGVRPGVDFERVAQERWKVNARIPDPALRRKADSMVHFHLGRLARHEGRPLQAWKNILRSVLTYPGPLDPRIGRARFVLEWILPGPVRSVLGRARRAVTGSGRSAG